MTPRVLCNFAIASCDPEGGIYIYRLLEDGSCEQIKKLDMPSPMFMQLCDGKLWVALRAPFADSANSGVAAYDPASGERLGELVSTQGVVACHLVADGDDVYCANYVTGSVFKYPDVLVEHEGHGINPQRQERAHVHSTFLSPDKKYVISCDLGVDKVFVYDRELREISCADVPAGSGARHVAFSADGKYLYCINEMSATVSVFAYCDGKLTYLSEVDLKPAGFDGQGKGSAIKMSADGKRMYLTERGSETVVLASVCGEKLEVLSHFACHGVEPRDFELLGGERFAACCNQFSDNVSFYSVADDGSLEHLYDLPLKTPICVIPYDIEL